MKPSSRTVDDTVAGSVATSRANSRHANLGDISRNRTRSHVTPKKEEATPSRQSENKEEKNTPEAQTPRRQAASRRIASDASAVWLDDAKLEHEVFTKLPGHSRSRTGRKIYTGHHNEKETKKQVQITQFATENTDKIEEPKNGSRIKEETRSTVGNVTSKVNASRKIDASANNGQDKIKDRDVLLSGSESVRVDIPLTIGTEQNTNLVTASSVNASTRQTARPIKEAESDDIARSNAKKSRHSDRSKSRGRGASEPNVETTANSGSSRRSSSRLGGSATAETNERPSNNSRHRSSAKSVNSRSRSKSRDANATETRGRDRTADPETNANGRTEARRGSSTDRRTGSEGKRRTKDGRSKAAETKMKQDARAQPRSRSRSASNLGE